MKKLYLYPLTARTENAIINPYIGNLRDALKKEFDVVNAQNPSKIGIFDILWYLRKLDLVYFNWIEELPSLHRGKLQGLFLLILIPYLKFSKIKIIWTLHNKESHYDQNLRLKNRLFRQMLVKSDLIITHAKEGLNLIPEGKKAAFLHHPFNTPVVGSSKTEDSKFDIIIWGTIAPYKGIASFLKFLEQKGTLSKYRILLAGKVTSPELAQQLKEFDNKYSTLELMDGYIEKDLLIRLIGTSRITLFTYHSDSVLSSGALMDSLSYGANIVGPAAGAFNDLCELGIIETYSDFLSLTELIDRMLVSPHKNVDRQKATIEFINANSWDAFSQSITNLINN